MPNTERITHKAESVGLSSGRLERIKTTMQRYIDEGKFAGMVTLVSRQGKIVHFETHGHADIESAQPMAEDTVFRIYSMTKPITAVAAMMLYEEGRFRLSDPVADYIPAFAKTRVLARLGLKGMELADQERPMTIHDLMVHTAGFTYGVHQDSPVDDMYRQARVMPPLHHDSLERWVQAVAQLPLFAQPGTTWRYSLSMGVLGYLVECLSGQSLGDFFAERIFAPLGMEDTGFHVPAQKVNRLASCYSPSDQGVLQDIDPVSESPFVRPPLVCYGGGSLVSTATDYHRFCQMMLNGGVLDGNRLLGRKTVELMTLNHLPPALMPIGDDHANHGYGQGLGSAILVDVAASKQPGSVGTYTWGGAANTNFWVDPQEQLIGIFMTQFMPNHTYPVTEDFRILTYQAIED